jgi:hypothetical protein
MRYGRALAAVNMCGYDGRHWYHGGQGWIIDWYGDVQAVLPGIQLLERQRPRFTHAQIDFDDLVMVWKRMRHEADSPEQW